jgi:hypothetical protein
VLATAEQVIAVAQLTKIADRHVEARPVFGRANNDAAAVVIALDLRRCPA